MSSILRHAVAARHPYGGVASPSSSSRCLRPTLARRRARRTSSRRRRVAVARPSPAARLRVGVASASSARRRRRRRLCGVVARPRPVRRRSPTVQSAWSISSVHALASRTPSSSRSRLFSSDVSFLRTWVDDLLEPRSRCREAVRLVSSSAGSFSSCGRMPLGDLAENPVHELRGVLPAVDLGESRPPR